MNHRRQNDLHEKVMNALHEVGLLRVASRFPTTTVAVGAARPGVMQPEFIVADEPSLPALDVSIRCSTETCSIT